MTFSPKLAGGFVIMLGVFVLMYVIVYFFAKRAAVKRYGRAEATLSTQKMEGLIPFLITGGRNWAGDWKRK